MIFEIGGTRTTRRVIKLMKQQLSGQRFRPGRERAGRRYPGWNNCFFLLRAFSVLCSESHLSRCLRGGGALMPGESDHHDGPEMGRRCKKMGDLVQKAGTRSAVRTLPSPIESVVAFAAIVENVPANTPSLRPAPHPRGAAHLPPAGGSVRPNGQAVRSLSHAEPVHHCLSRPCVPCRRLHNRPAERRAHGRTLGFTRYPPWKPLRAHDCADGRVRARCRRLCPRPREGRRL